MRYHGVKMKQNRQHKKRITRAARNSRRRNVLAATVAIAMIALVAYQAISDLINGRIGGENYYGQPVGPGLQLIVLAVITVIGTILGWRHLFSKPSAKDKQKKRDGSGGNGYRHEQMPW